MSKLKVSGRTSILLVVWILVTAGLALFTNNFDWTSTPLNFVSFILLIALIVSVLFDNSGKHRPGF